MRLRGSDPIDVEQFGETLIPMATLERTKHGGSIRTFYGGKGHENGWWPSWKSGRNQHWEGTTQRSYLQLQECETPVRWAQAEPATFHFPPIAGHESYTPDVEVAYVDGRRTFVELKRSPDDLKDPSYRLMLAMIVEICRRIDIEFQVVFADDIFLNRQHQLNVELFSSRRFTRVTHDDLVVLERHGRDSGQRTTYGRLAEILMPDWPVAGRAIIQGLLVRRRVEIDLTQFIHDETPVLIN
jgi:hypothetical protein